MVTDRQLLALRQAVDANMPVALYILPHSDEACFVCDDGSGVTHRRLEIFPWLATEPAVINANLDETADFALFTRADHPSNPIFNPEISILEYAASVGPLIERLKERGGKTVISRVVNGDCADWLASVKQLLDTYDDGNFRIFWNHPATGAWLMSTPEILLHADTATGRFMTMSLAGTRQAGNTDRWDEKNLREQQIVTDTIVDDLGSLGVQAEVGPTTTRRSGAIEHICTEISGDLQGVSPSDIARRLSPTPALGGYPRAEALADIAAIERHQRRCYGGYIALTDREMYRAFVTIRCVQLDPAASRYCAYAGGGITADSDPAAEWSETQSKLATII